MSHFPYDPNYLIRFQYELPRPPVARDRHKAYAGTIHRTSILCFNIEKSTDNNDIFEPSKVAFRKPIIIHSVVSWTPILQGMNPIFDNIYSHFISNLTNYLIPQREVSL